MIKKLLPVIAIVLISFATKAGTTYFNVTVEGETVVRTFRLTDDLFMDYRDGYIAVCSHTEPVTMEFTDVRKISYNSADDRMSLPTGIGSSSESVAGIDFRGGILSITGLSGAGEYAVHNLSGHRIAVGRFENNVMIDLSGLSHGTYICSVTGIPTFKISMP